MKRGFILSGLFFGLTVLYLVSTIQKLPETISTQMWIGQLFSQTTSLDWSKTEFLQFFIGIFVFMNILIHGILPWWSRRSNKPREISKEKLKVVYSNSGAYMNLVFLIAYLATLEINGLNTFLPYFVLIATLFVTTLWFVVWVLKYVKSSTPV